MERLNQVTLIGNVGNVNSGDKSFYFSLALNESYKPKDATDWVEKTVWVDVIAFGPVMEKVKKAGIDRGHAVMVVGKLDMKEYEGKRSLQVIAQKVQPLFKAKRQEPGEPPAVDSADTNSPDNSDDDDLPF